MGSNRVKNGGPDCMIASGVCVMGGCFAQNEDSSNADCYWPAAEVDVPRYASSVGLYEYDYVEAGVDLEDCHVYTMQVPTGGNSSFFFVFQNNRAVYNCYLGNNSLEIQTDANVCFNRKEATPFTLIFHCGKDGAFCPLQGGSAPPATWDSSVSGTRLRILDARNGTKRFCVTYGQWGYKWYLLPMKSAGLTTAVFDVEAKVLVEL